MDKSARSTFIFNFKRIFKQDLSISEYNELLEKVKDPKFAGMQSNKNEEIKYFIFSYKGYGFGVIFDKFLERLVRIEEPIKKEKL